jgi:hypothetical protein
VRVVAALTLARTGTHARDPVGPAIPLRLHIA